jgi:WhiB family redox-sensing transcriptional regulator
MEDAACADTTDVDWFDIDCGLEAAITICHTCAVRADCLNYAVSHNIIEGIWAGYWGEGLATQVRTRRQGGGG